MELTPIDTRSGAKTHATVIDDPIGQTVLTLCGKRVRPSASYTRGTFDRHAANTIPGYTPGACLKCVEAAGLTHLLRPRPTVKDWDVVESS